MRIPSWNYQVAQGASQLLGHGDFPPHGDPAFLLAEQHIQGPVLHKLLHHDVCGGKIRDDPPGIRAGKGAGNVPDLLSEPRTQTPCTKARCTWDTWDMRLALSKNACGDSGNGRDVPAFRRGRRAPGSPIPAFWSCIPAFWSPIPALEPHSSPFWGHIPAILGSHPSPFGASFQSLLEPHSSLFEATSHPF